MAAQPQDIAERLTALSQIAEGEVTGEKAHAALVEATEAVGHLKQGEGWSALDGSGLSAVTLTRNLGDIIKAQPDTCIGVQAAVLYASLLGLQNAPAGTLCDPYTFAGFLHCLKKAFLPLPGSGSGRGGQDTQGTHGGAGGAEDANEAARPAAPVACLEDVGTFLATHSMRGNVEMFSLLLDTLVDLTGSVVVPGVQQRGVGARRGAATNRCVAEAAFALLQHALQARHGNLLQAASAVFQRLTPVLLGAGGAPTKRGAAGAPLDRRSVALSFIQDLFTREPAIRPAITALLRYMCVRVVDKADCRQLAVTSIVMLATRLSAADQQQLCLFLLRLSRNAKVSSRQMAVELAHSLLMNLSRPFTLEGTYKALLDGSLGPGDEVAAPWSALCLAVLVQRSSDKVAGVRSKAMACVSEIVTSFATLLSQAMQRDAASRSGSGAGSEQGDEAALGGFVLALCAVRHIRLQVQAPSAARRRKDAEGDDRDDDANHGDGAMDVDEEAAEQAAQEGDDGTDTPKEFAPPPQVVASATLPDRVSMDLSWLSALARERVRDDKAAVRKAGLQLLEGALCLNAVLAAQQRAHGAPVGVAAAAACPTAEDLAVMEATINDPMVSVRKAALQAVCGLAEQFPTEAATAQLWARCALPMVRDPETAIQELLLDKVQELLLKRAQQAAAAGGRGGSRAAAAAATATAACDALEPLLGALSDMGRAASSCLCRVLTMLTARRQLQGAQVAAGIQAIITANSSKGDDAAAGAGPSRASTRLDQQQRYRQQVMEGAWLLLAEVAGQDPAAPDWQFLRRCWQELQAGGGGGAGGGQQGALLLVAISHSASRFPRSEAQELAGGLLQALFAFNLPCAAIGAHVAALHRLTQAAAGGVEDGGVGTPAQWCTRVLQAAEELLGRAVEARGELESSLRQHCELALFTIGELTLLREAKVGAGAAVKVQALTAARIMAGGSGASSEGPSQASQAAEPLGSAPLAVGIADSLSGHAWTCLGKLCMVDEQLAKKCAPLLVQEMCRCPSAVVRNNLLVALSDMVVQFTGLVDTYVGRLAAMVRDPHELVRRQALALLSNLLGRDYVKWRGALFHRFLLALVDDCAAVRSMAQYLLSDTLLAAKAPLLAYNHFVEALFSLNDCRAGMYGSRIGASLEDLPLEDGAPGGSRFHLKGDTPAMRAKRDVVYHALAKRMVPEHRFAASAKLVAEVLGGVVDGMLPIEECGEVLGDALRLLGSKEMKVGASRFGAGADDDGAGDGGLTGTQQEDVAKARGKLVSAMMRKHLVESVVPLLVELRHMLQAQKHPLLPTLMACTAALLRDYKAELEDILVADKQMAREILHDIKQYEAMSRLQQQQQHAAAGNADAAAPAAAAGAAPGAPPAAMPAAVLQQQHSARRTPVLAGVTPGRTPMAAEVLATAAKQRRQAALASRNGTPHQTPGRAAAPAAMHTPGTGLLPGSGANAQAMRTPFTGAKAAGPGAALPMLSPAPLSARARPPQAGRAAPLAGAPLPPAAPRAGGSSAGTSAATAADLPAAAAPQVVTVLLPDPTAAASEQPLQQWDVNLGERQRPRPEVLKAAVASAKKAAREALGPLAGQDDEEEEQVPERQGRPGRCRKKPVLGGVKVKEEPDQGQGVTGAVVDVRQASRSQRSKGSRQTAAPSATAGAAAADGGGEVSQRARGAKRRNKA